MEALAVLNNDVMEECDSCEQPFYERDLDAFPKTSEDEESNMNTPPRPDSENEFNPEDLVIEDLTGEFTLDDYEFSEKLVQIENLMNSDTVDKNQLKNFARSSGGFVTDELRRKAWGILMDLQSKETSKLSEEEAKKCKYYNQVVMDVNRSLKRFPPGIDEPNRYLLMDQLILLIVKVLLKHPELHYYQGYHDVAITFLLVMGEEAAFELVEKLSVEHLKDFMKPTMERTVHYLTYIYPILKRANPEIHDILERCEVGTIFCLPWLITWYAHTLNDYRDVVRLYDFFLASPFLMPIYFAVAIVAYKEKEILNQEQDMAILHSILSKIPNTFPFEKLLEDASDLYNKYPPTDEIEKEVLEILERQAKEEKKRAEERKLLEQKLKALKEASAKRRLALASNASKSGLSSKWFIYAGVALAGIVIEEGLRQYYFSNSPLFNWFSSFSTITSA